VPAGVVRYHRLVDLVAAGRGPLEFRVDAKELSALFAAAKAAEGQIQVELRRGIKAAAKPVVDAIKADAGFSSRIPASIKAKASFAKKGASVLIVADAKKAPEAGPLNNKGKGGSFKHPVFGTDTWVQQAARPFFQTGALRGAPAADKAMLTVMDDIARKLGFH
jgi:hypothetical protein